MVDGNPKASPQGQGAPKKCHAAYKTSEGALVFAKRYLDSMLDNGSKGSKSARCGTAIPDDSY